METLVERILGSLHESQQEDPALATVVRMCLYCDNKLIIPAKVLQEVNSAKQRRTHYMQHHEGFFVSGSGNFYCDNTCFNRFTED